MVLEVVTRTAGRSIYSYNRSALVPLEDSLFIFPSLVLVTREYSALPAWLIRNRGSLRPFCRPSFLSRCSNSSHMGDCSA